MIGRLLFGAHYLIAHHTRCRIHCCKPDWLEKIMLGLPAPRCQRCKRTIS